MTTTRLPEPAVRKTAGVDLAALERDLRDAVDGEVRFDPGSRGAYSTDGSNYRQVPLGVVVPRSVDAGVAAVGVCHRHRAPLFSRGGGTSLGGQCCNTAVVVDWTKYCDRLVSVDTDARTCVVEPGIVLDVLNAKLEPYGLMFGPKPSTHANCALGGMIGNNSCGSTAQAYGKVVDNVRRLEVLTHDGARFWTGAVDDEKYERVQRAGGRQAEIYAAMRSIADRYADEIREHYPDIPRRVSGYNLDSLLPEYGFDIGRALVGTESTCVTVLRAELELVPVPKADALVVLGYHDVCASADAVPAILRHEPAQLEGVDERLVSFERQKGEHRQGLAELPPGGGWLMVGFSGDSQDEADGRARALVDDLDGTEHQPSVKFYDDQKHEQELWEVREGGLGATARVPGMPETWEGWEDSAVPPDRLGDYLRDLQRLYDEYGYSGASLYGHFGHGCVHTRIPFDLSTRPGIDRFRAFLDEASDVVVGYGGSFSGEHGDGQARGALLPKMFGATLMTAFGEFKAAWDPDGLMNPGKIVDPYQPDENLRLGADWSPADPPTHFQYPDDDGSFQRAVMRCVGVGKCRQNMTTGGAVMCPSYQVTKEDEHSTRGRSRLLFEMLDGHADSVVRDGWRSTAVRDALDLCLACKGCKHDCPMQVDMATYKAEFLSHHYARRVRPAAHYSMGWLPVWSRLASLAPRAANLASHTPGLSHLAKLAGGVATEREMPRFAPLRFTDWYGRRGPRGTGENGPVLLWPDTFTNNFQPEIGAAAVQVLESAGYRVVLPRQTLCCGLTWISTGQLATAKRVLRRTLAALAPLLRAGVPVVGLEPSCTAVFRADAHELFPFDKDVLRLKDQTYTLAEFLLQKAPDWRPEPLDRDAVMQMHCHQHAIMGEDPDGEICERVGVHGRMLSSGCCGLAGNFGFERGHYDVSMACAERVLLPEVRDVDPGVLVIADGFSCRTQVEQAHVGRTPVHLAEVLAAAVRRERLGDRPERTVRRPLVGAPG
ncbi:MAG: FAD-binding protein [Streptosporangiales bacterium]|nr:FAD-binding protein [Streptosporangiales bacterium]MBO0891424.1 FAD-binding protein [Acidothermales bacterium]